MNDVVSGAEALSGQAEQAPQDAGQEGNAASQNIGGGEQNAPWYGDLDGDIKGWVENKGWKSQKDALQSAWNLEKLLGADKAGNAVVIPKEGDADAWNAFYERLGRPQTPNDYKFNLQEGDEESEIGQWFRDQAHKLGLNQQQAAALFEGFDQLMGSQAEQSQADLAAKAQQEMTELKREWGQAFEDNIMAGRKAARQFDLGEETLNKIEDALGTKGMLELMAKIGNSIGEHSFETGTNRAGGFGLTPAAAKQQIAELQADSQFQAAYLDAQHVGHKEAVQKMQRLQQAAYPGGN